MLVLGVLPTFPGVSNQPPIQAELIRALQMARYGMETVSAEIRL